MTRKHRNQTGRNITYDLSNPRNEAAFEALLEDEEDEAGPENVPTKPSKATRQQQGRKKREKEKFFMLRSDAAADANPPESALADSQQDQILQLVEMFGGNADRSLITDVYHASGCSVEAAAEALFSLLGGPDTIQGRQPFSGLTSTPIPCALSTGLVLPNMTSLIVSHPCMEPKDMQPNNAPQQGQPSSMPSLVPCPLGDLNAHPHHHPHLIPHPCTTEPLTHCLPKQRITVLTRVHTTHEQGRSSPRACIGNGWALWGLFCNLT
jgi:hypothetical protein